MLDVQHPYLRKQAEDVVNAPDAQAVARILKETLSWHRKVRDYAMLTGDLVPLQREFGSLKYPNKLKEAIHRINEAIAMSTPATMEELVAFAGWALEEYARINR